MQTFTSWFGGAPGIAGAHGPSTLQSISEQIRDLPQQFFRQTGGSVNSTGEGTCGRRYGYVSGDHQFHFTLHVEPRSDGRSLCQTGVLVASAASRPDGGQPVPITCHWKRRIGAHLVEIQGISGNTYHASADDVGMEIVCQAEAACGGFAGTAIGVLGPFELDPITQMSLEKLICCGFGPFPVRHYRDQDDRHPRDLMIHVSPDFVKVVHPGADRGSAEVSAEYSSGFPKIVIHPLDTCKFRLELSDDRDKVYHFQALSRTSRDLIALIIRCFHSRQYIATSFMLSRLFQNPATPGAPLTSLQSPTFDVHAQGSRLSKELDRTVVQLQAVEKGLRNANEEKSQLQAQLRETISSYTEAIEKLHQQLSFAQGGPAASVQLQLHDARAVHSRLQLEMQELKPTLEEERQYALAEVAQSEHKQEAGELRAQITRLRTDISSLAGDAAVNSQRDHTRAEELRRLRNDVECLSQEKGGLERCAMQADKEKQDLIENFLYVKGCLDKLQMASLEIPAPSPEAERELSQLKASYGQMVDERNRYAVRLEALDRDREKQKAQRESALERVMNANARLLEERDKLEKEKARMSEMYQQSMGAMGVMQSGPGDASKGPPGSSGDASTLEALNKDMARKTEQLSKLEQEGESLRSRLRKLAMV